MHRTIALLVGEAHLRLIIDICQWIEQQKDLIAFAISDCLEQLIVSNTLVMPERGPRHAAFLRGYHLKHLLFLESGVIVCCHVITLLDVLLDVMDAQILVLFDIVDQLHLIRCDCHDR